MTITPHAVQLAVAQTYGITLDRLRRHDRHASIARARHVAMYLMRRLCGMSYPEIGRSLGNRHHATVMHGVCKVEFLVMDDRKLRTQVFEIENKLRAAAEPAKEAA